MAVAAAIFGRVKLQYQRSLLASSFRCDLSLDSFPQHLLYSGLHLSASTSAGHNKWSKVKYVKGPRDAARSRIFSKLTMMIRAAVREGGVNPGLNANLGRLIKWCRLENMPKASIERAIKGGEKTKDLTYFLYEGRGPGCFALLIEILTDNNNRTRQEMKSIMNKNGGSLDEKIQYCFDKKGVVMVRGEDKENKVVGLERALELAIEANAEDVQEAEEVDEKTALKFICDIPQLHEVGQKLDSLGLFILSVAPEFIPNTMVQLSDDEMAQAAHLLQLLMDHQEVMRVYDNIS